MGAEYVRFENTEAKNHKRALLETQVHVLQSAKQLQTYKKIRAEELLLKIQLKQKVEALYEQLELLNRLLPATEFKLPTHKESAPSNKQDLPEQHSSTLEDELASIQRKLQTLQ